MEQKKEYKKLKYYFNKIIIQIGEFRREPTSKLQFLFNQFILLIKSFWTYIWQHKLIASIISLFFAFIFFIIPYCQSERIAEESNISFKNASNERQNNYEQIVKKFEEMDSQNQARSQNIEEFFSEKFDTLEERVNELNRQSITTSKNILPPLKIFSEEPYSEFACFNYIVFNVVEETKEKIIFSNDDSDPVVSFSFTYVKEDGSITYDPLKIHFNEENGKASYENYLGFLLFAKAQASNSRLVFWNLIDDKAFIRTEPIIPVNLRYDHEGTKALITFLNKIIRIERFVGEKIPFKFPPTESIFKDVNYVYEVLRGKPMEIGFKFERKLNNLEEKEWFLNSIFKTNIQNVRYRMEGENHIIKIYDVPIELGMWTIDFPDSNIVPNLEDLHKDKSNKAVTVTIEAKDHDKKIVLFYNTLRREYRLSDPPLPIFPKHPLMKE
jgi:hypothetical protein